MVSSSMPDRALTEYAPPQRAPRDVLMDQASIVGAQEVLTRLFDAVNDLVVILNAQRQIVFANSHFLKLLGMHDLSPLLGQRPGEALHCLRACEAPGGCGTSEFCSACGAVNAILTSQAGREDVRECRISTETGDSLDLLVRATPIDLSGQRFTVFAVSDISHEKRRRILERIFFHDLLNTAVGVQMMSELVTKSAATGGETRQALVDCVHLMMDQITEQRDLMAAEALELAVRPCEVDVRELLADMVQIQRSSPAGRDKQVELSPQCFAGRIHIDIALLARVLGNMIKNALEACPSAQTVTVGSVQLDGGVEFFVHNPGVMPRDVQLQLFQRSFSTKGTGRGLGTYSIRLLTERYLKGRVSFTSDDASGTTFRAWYPLRPGA